MNKAASRCKELLDKQGIHLAWTREGGIKNISLAQAMTVALFSLTYTEALIEEQGRVNKSLRREIKDLNEKLDRLDQYMHLGPVIEP